MSRERSSSVVSVVSVVLGVEGSYPRERLASSNSSSVFIASTSLSADLFLTPSASIRRSSKPDNETTTPFKLGKHSAVTKNRVDVVLLLRRSESEEIPWPQST